MQPFSVSDELRNVIGPYPPSEVILEAGKNGGHESRAALARLWLSEGIPYAFKDCPAVYEAMRSWLSNNLDVCAKSLSLVGSARIGTSLAPGKSGNVFRNRSDLDLVAVCPSLFHELRTEFCQWSRAYEDGRIESRNAREERFWNDNSKRGHRLIQRGFIDKKMIPNLDLFPKSKLVGDVMALLVRGLEATKDAPRPSSASLRCYISWDAFIRQISLSLRDR